VTDLLVFPAVDTAGHCCCCRFGHYCCCSAVLSALPLPWLLLPLLLLPVLLLL
jgi:hypothetical protein